MKEKINKSSGAMKLFVFGASLAGLAAAYFFIRPKSREYIENTKSWVIKMKGDVIEKLEQAREISEDIYNKIIDSVATKYEKELKSSPEEVKALAKDLKTHWRAISRAAKDKEANEAKEEKTARKT